MGMDRILIGGMAAMIGLAVIAGMAEAYSPGLDYVCPIDGARFATYEELYRHFTTHPTMPIAITWE